MENLRVVISKGVIVSCNNYLEGEAPANTLPAPEYIEDNPWDIGWLWSGDEVYPSAPPGLYAEKRKQEYDQLNQFEMQFDDQQNGTTTWVDAINEIKERYPK